MFPLVKRLNSLEMSRLLEEADFTRLFAWTHVRSNYKIVSYRSGYKTTLAYKTINSNVID
jgi:hypothetical protein